MEDFKVSLRPILLRPCVQHYSWGDPDFLPDLLGLENPERRPHAELWIGAHPALPSGAVLGDREVGLDRLIEEDGEAILGPEISRRFRGLPFLLKVLSAARPLSIQVHPDKCQAEEGFARESAAGIPLSAPHRSYRDENHKPELIVALTDFHALRGFRPLEEIREVLRETPEFRDLSRGFEPTSAGLRALYEEILGLPQERVDAVLTPLVERLAGERRATPLSEGDPRYWALLADEEYSQDGRRDRGIFSIFLLNLLHLRPGQGLYLSAGVLHSYLRGAGVEVMASSDNVLRCGLTRKPTDAAEVLRTVRFEGERPEAIEAELVPETLERIWRTPAREFELRRIEVSPAILRRAGPARGAEILLVTAMEESARPRILCGESSLELRRGAACLIPHGAAYTIEAEGPATIYKAAVATPPDSPAPAGPTFRGREPAKLAFGTSGLRGLVSDITDLEAYIAVRGFLDYLFSIGDVRPGGVVALAGDLRPSTDRILRAAVQAVGDSGLAAENLGEIPTPALISYAIERRRPSIMVTGSHIPFDRNGLKLAKSSGEVLKSDEPGILAGVEKVRATEYGRREEESLFGDDGMFRSDVAPPLPPVLSPARAAYVRRYLDFFPPGCLEGRRIVLYEHSSVGREVLAEILAGLGAEVIPLGRSREFVAIDTEAISIERLCEIQRLVDEARRLRGPMDALVSTDGDGDRPLLVGIDREGRAKFFGGDLLGVVVADYLGADSIAVPVSSSDAVDLHFEGRGLRPVRTRIGSPFVISAMLEGKGARKVGWEANGGFLTGSDIEKGGRVLRALPTRDAALPILAALHGAFSRGLSLAEVFSRLPRRFSRSGLLDAFPVEAARALLRRFSPRDVRVARASFEGGRATILDNDGNAMEASGAALEDLLGLRERLGKHFSARRGFGEVLQLDFLDGVRVRFAGGDIAHFRPSGNAPQLRIYAVTGEPERAEQIVEEALREPGGILREMERAVAGESRVESIRANIEHTRRLFEEGRASEVIGIVSGSEGARRFWQGKLDEARESFRAREALSFVEDLPTNQAFGILLLWQRLKERLRGDRGALVAFVFGEGTRSAPFTEAEIAQKPAIATFARSSAGGRTRHLSMVELALRFFAPVEERLRRSGFRGLAIKWGDEVQIPALDLSGEDPRLDGADVVRFVSFREMDQDEAASKDWVAVDDGGRVTSFIPRRPIGEMEKLADLGLLRRRGGRLHGGINLGSIALSRDLLDALLEEFEGEVNDPKADRGKRPDLDPQFFTALTIAALGTSAERARSWERALRESASLRALERDLPGILQRLRGVLERLQKRRGRELKMVAMDFGDLFWGDIGQHRKIHEFYMALNDPGALGEIARAIAGIPDRRDGDGNILAGRTSVNPRVKVRDSVLLDAVLAGEGTVERCVLIGTRAGDIRARDAFDVLSAVGDLTLKPRAGSYRVISAEPVRLGPGERATTLYLPGGESLFRVHEDTDLRDRSAAYDVPILGNPLSFREAHEAMARVRAEELAARRERSEREVMERFRS